jgi:ABC-type transport system involved in cytochrome c biogenesis ATPase subunit
MLIEFRVGNYRSFHGDQVLSMVASADDSHPGNLIATEKGNLLKAVAVYGANASGKSNLLRAFGVMQSLVKNSATTMNVGDNIDVMPFRLAPDSRQRPSLFEITLLSDGVRYRYGFTATARRVHDEWLVAYPKGRAQQWFERRLDAKTGETRWIFRGGLKKTADLLRSRTRDNGLLLSRGAELNVSELVPLFESIAVGCRYLDMSDAPTMRMIHQAVADTIRDDPAFRDEVSRVLREADFGIGELQVNLSEDSRRPFNSEFLAAIPMEMRPVFDGTHPLTVQAIHSIPGTKEIEVFDLDEAESNGTQRFFALAGLWLLAFRNGRMRVVDELDCSLHPVLTRKLVQLFQSPEVNKKGTQLIFATHDSTLMDQSLFRRDQIWLVEKDAGQASRLFSLYDFEDTPRKGEALEKRYLAGRYGAVPSLGPTFEELDFR